MKSIRKSVANWLHSLTLGKSLLLAFFLLVVVQIFMNTNSHTNATSSQAKTANAVVQEAPAKNKDRYTSYYTLDECPVLIAEHMGIPADSLELYHKEVIDWNMNYFYKRQGPGYNIDYQCKMVSGDVNVRWMTHYPGVKPEPSRWHNLNIDENAK